MKEVWVDIVGYEGYYEISNLGNIRGVSRIIKSNWGYCNKPWKSKTLSLCVDSSGYLSVSLSSAGKKKTWRVHVLMSIVFMKPESGLQVNHKDGNKLNNKLENLELVTPSENIQHAIDNNLIPYKRLLEQDIKEIKEMLECRLLTQRQIAKSFKVDRKTIYNVKYDKI